MSEKKPHIERKKSTLLPWVTAVLLVLGISVLAAMYWTRNVSVTGVEVSQTYFTQPEEIILAADVPVGIKPDSLDLDELITKVEVLDYIYSVSPYIEPNGDLLLTVTERSPLGLLVDGKDRIYVDAYGVKLPILEGKTLDLPLVYGFDASSTSDTLRSEEFEQIRNFLLGARANEFGWVTISEVTYSADQGVVALSHENGVKLIFGDNDFETKLRNWKAFYVEVIRTKGIQHIQQVDLRFKNQVVTRET